MVHAALPTAIRIGSLLLIVFLPLALGILCLLDGTVNAAVEDTEILDLITHAKHPVTTECLVELYAGHREVHHTSGAIFHLSRQVILEGGIDTQQRRESLVDAHRRHIKHRRGLQAASSLISNKAQTIHILAPGTVGSIASHAIDTLIGMIQIEALEMVAYPRQFR